MASSRALMRLLIVAFLLLFKSDTIGRAGISVQRHHNSHPGIAAADYSALLETAPARNDVDTARLHLLASEASLPDCQVQSAPAPTRDSSSLCSYEHTTPDAARPPPLRA